MEWHIVTASKGGVGKTLITLLLLTHYLGEDPDTSTLVIDLNAMNTDTSAMLLTGGGGVHEKTFVTLEPSKNVLELRATANPQLLVAYPMDPFVFYGREQFAELITGIREKADNKMTAKFNAKPLRRVIIDTNYHFCNLFPPKEENYDVSSWQQLQKSLKEDDLNVWFIWVYRQLKKIILGGTDETAIVVETARTLEKIFPPKAKKMGPLIHAYAPVGLLPTDTDISFLAKLFAGSRLPVFGEDFSIPELKKLENMSEVGQYLRFPQWYRKLETAYLNIVDQNRAIDTHQLFAKVLYESIKNDKDVLPINVFPISLYEAALAGYTDKERQNMIAGLRQLEVFKNFKNLLRLKIENG
jgi:hypothetical protein